VGHKGRGFGQALNSSQTLGKGEKADVLEKALHGFNVSLDSEADHASKSILLLLGQLVLGVRGKPRIDHLGAEGGGFKVSCHGKGVLLVLLHPEVKGFQSAVGHEAVERAGDGSNRVLKESKLVGNVLSVGGSNSHNDVRVSVDVLGDGVHDYICSKAKGILCFGGIASRGEGEEEGRKDMKNQRKPGSKVS